MRITGQLFVVAVLLAVGAAGVSAAGLDDPFLKGLQERGLPTLQKAYLRKLGAGQATPGTGPAATTSAGAGVEKAALAALEVQTGLAARIIADRDASFRKARQLYEEAIDEGNKALAALPIGQKQDERNRLRLQVLKLRLDLANLIFQKWLKTDLDLLEVTDRRGGNRSRTVDLLRVCMAQYKAIAAESAAWLSEIDRMTMAERNKFANTGTERQLRQIQREAKYDEAWVTYYLGWALPPDHKPEGKERSRKDLLNDAITAFMEYTGPTISDKTTAKWHAYLVVGLAYRELGKFKEALESLVQADRLAQAALAAGAKEGASAAVAAQAKVAQAVRIRVAFERAMTFLRRGDFKAARSTADEAAGFWKEKLDTEVLGQAVPVVKAESLILEARQKGDEAMKQEGVKVLQALYTRPQPWPMIVQWMMEGLLGAATASAGAGGAEAAEDLAKMDPFQVWLKASDALERAQKTKEAKDCETALRLFNVYAEKVGPKDKNYAAALYSQSACLLQLGRKVEAGALFQKVADEFPTYQYATPAARYAVSARGDAYERETTEDNRQAYEDTLKWFLASRYVKEDPEQQFFYAMILFRGKKHVEAADSFARVPQGAEHYPDARYWVPLCHMEQFRDKILTSRDKSLIVTRARVVAQELLGFADYAFKAAGLPEEKKAQIMEWAKIAHVTAADLYLYPEVELPSDALPVLDAVEQKFELDDEDRGRVLKLRIDALQKLGKQDEALAVLEKFLKVAKKEDVGPVLRGLFKAITDEVRELVKRADRDSLSLAGRKVDQAKALGERLTRWLDENNVADKALQVENNRYDLAELYLAVENYRGALDIYKEIGGEQAWKKQPLKLDCVYGVARAYEGLAEQARQAAEAAGQKDPPYSSDARQNYETALEIWTILQEVAEGEGRQSDPNILWDRRYHVFYSSFRLGKATEVAEALKKRIIIERPGALGGRDPILQKKFRDLLQMAGGAD
ncbi:MAG: hypothetical protein FJ288_10305 [Planctomycetes bacterium]|nr:hypothetical protein [Planctomycetota bacterium]